MPNKSRTAGYAGLNLEHMLHEHLVSSMIALDSGGEIVAQTPEAGKLFGKSRHPVLPAPLRPIVRKAQKTGQCVSNHKVFLRAGGAKPSAFQVTAMPLRTGSRSGDVVLLLKDLSEAGKLEHKLRRLDRLASVGTLTASMAHEAKNALVAIHTFVELLLEKNRDAELAEIVPREIGRVDAIISQMLRLGAPAQPVFSTVSLHKILDHSLRLVQHRVESKLISFDRQFSATPDLLEADDRQLEQAFVNLFLNAVEAIGGHGGRLAIGTEVAARKSATRLRARGALPQFFQVRINDSGAGIAPEHLTQIFEPFFTTKHTGTGLGLPVTRRIIEEHGGSIHVESQAGKGTTFTILLPASSRAAAR